MHKFLWSSLLQVQQAPLDLRGLGVPELLVSLADLVALPGRGRPYRPGFPEVQDPLDPPFHPADLPGLDLLYRLSDPGIPWGLDRP